MSYTTVYKSSEQNEIVQIKKTFEENNVRYEILEGTTNANALQVQVHGNDVKRAEGLLLENGFLENPDPGESSGFKSKFWLWLVIALICLVIAAYLITIFMTD